MGRRCACRHPAGVPPARHADPAGRAALRYHAAATLSCMPTLPTLHADHQAGLHLARHQTLRALLQFTARPAHSCPCPQMHAGQQAGLHPARHAGPPGRAAPRNPAILLSFVQGKAFLPLSMCRAQTIRRECIQRAMLDQLAKPPPEFADVIRLHFKCACCRADRT